MAQTAVDWFFNKLSEKTQANNEKEYWEAKAMEKEQIISACNTFADYPFEDEDFETYYNETYTNGL